MAVETGWMRRYWARKTCKAAGARAGAMIGQTHGPAEGVGRDPRTGLGGAWHGLGEAKP